MRRRIQLYINSQAADLDEGSLVLFNYTKENIDNPSVVRNSYSKSITLKGTPRNSRIFEGMYRADRVSGSGQLSVLDRIPFKIVADGSVVLESGYCKIDEVKTTGAIHEYTITLYGGLGSFFYGLSTDEDGDALTLADLVYGADGEYDAETSVSLTATGLNTAWNELATYLSGRTLSSLGSIVNFNPCYNGVPDNFDNTKVMVHAGDYDNTPSSINALFPKSDASSKYILNMGREYDMQDTNDCRAYLMRPMINVRAVLAAISAYAESEVGITFDYSDIISNGYVKDAWVTLANIPEEYRSAGTITLGEMLEGTPSPCAFLISLARVLGFSFITVLDNNATQGLKVSIVSRNTFFSDRQTIDLTAKVDRAKGITLAPVYADTRWFDFSLEGVGEDAESHAEKYDREYGSQRVDTNYQFGEGTTNLYDGNSFKISAEVIESGIDADRAVIGYQLNDAETVIDAEFLLPVRGSALQSGNPTAELYSESGSGDMEEVALPREWEKYQRVYEDYTQSVDEWFVRNQMCGEDRKAEDGIGVLMILQPSFLSTAAKTVTLRVRKTDGTQITRDVTIPARTYNLHSYDAVMVDLTGGEECWDMTQSAASLQRTSIPIWGNSLALGSDYNNDYNNDYGGGSVSILPTGIYSKMWQRYIEDRYDKDARIMKCYVDFSGMQVGEDLLRNFYVIDDALWVLNKITNYSLTTYDAVECEFVKVIDKDNYINGQI